MAGVSKRAARRKIERDGDTICAPVCVLEQVSSYDEAAPCQESLWRRKSRGAQSFGHGSSRQGEQAGQRFGGDALVSARDRKECGVATRRRLYDCKAPRTTAPRLLDSACSTSARSARGHHPDRQWQSVHALLDLRRRNRVPAPPERCVRDECESWEALLEIAHPLEVRASSREQIDNGDADRLSLAKTQDGRPILARSDLMAVADGRSQSLQMRDVRQEGGNDAHRGDRGLRRRCGLSSQIRGATSRIDRPSHEKRSFS